MRVLPFLNSFHHSGKSANGSYEFFLSSLRDSCPSLLVTSSSRSKTESEDELDAALFPETRCASGPQRVLWWRCKRRNASSIGGWTLERQEVRNCLSCRECSSHLGSIVALDRWHTRGLCKACLAIGQQAFPRAVARLRTDSSHERTWVCTSPLAVNTTMGFLYLFTVPNSSELNSFLLINHVHWCSWINYEFSLFCFFFEVIGVDITFASPGILNVALSEFLSL